MILWDYENDETKELCILLYLHWAGLPGKKFERRERWTEEVSLGKSGNVAPFQPV